MTSEELELFVTDELFWDPRVDSAAIAVSAKDGEVTLRGTVGSFREKREAQKAAERIHGVTSVQNELKVRILGEYGREDADLRGSVLQALALDGRIPTTIDAKAYEGTVTLTGELPWGYQRDEAEFVVGNVLGVLDIDDQIKIMNPEPKVADVKGSIQKALQRTAKVDADGISVDEDDGTVALSGTVGSWFEHDAAVAAAWAAPGVVAVDDRILVEY